MKIRQVEHLKFLQSIVFTLYSQ